MIIELEKISQLDETKIEYQSYIFKINVGKKANLHTSSELNVMLNTLIKGGAIKVILNLKDLNFIDSSGIGTFINYTKMIRKNKGDIVFCNVSPDIENIFSVVNLQSFIKVFNSEVEAENYYRYINEE